MKKVIIIAFMLFFGVNALAQNTLFSKKIDTISHWKKSNNVGFDLSETTFVNWNAGGNNAISGLIKGNFTRTYTRDLLNWNTELFVRYGLNKQKGIEIRKTDDVIRLNSTVGFRRDSISNWYYSGKFNFNTQFTNGYDYPNINNPISKFFAPAYIFLGVGSEYINKPLNLNVYMSPLTMKMTLVLDQTLANQGAFGVHAAQYDALGTLIAMGKKSRTELGCLITSSYKTSLMKNVSFENRLNLYSDYINRFGNVDVDWQMQFDFIVNQYIRANFSTHLIYDDDIKAKDEINGTQVTVGPKIQLKQLLGIGVVYSFK